MEETEKDKTKQYAITSSIYVDAEKREQVEEMLNKAKKETRNEIAADLLHEAEIDLMETT